MAKAVRHELRPVRPLVEYQLTLTEDEAETLQHVFWFIGGDPGDSRRRHVNAISRALASAGANVINSKAFRGTLTALE